MYLQCCLVSQDINPNRTPVNVTINLPDELIPVRSPLLRESQLISFPPLTNMLKFRGFSRLIQVIYTLCDRYHWTRSDKPSELQRHQPKLAASIPQLLKSCHTDCGISNLGGHRTLYWPATNHHYHLAIPVPLNGTFVTVQFRFNH